MTDLLGLKDNYSAPVDRLLGLPKFGEGIGLHRMQRLLERLPAQSWLRGLDAIRVTGSKGKGSVSAIAAAILRQLGLRTGLYTSPHLLRFHERIQIDGEPIPTAGLAAATDWVFEDARKLGSFEAITGAALHYFASQAVEALVSEAGLGGRFDSTRPIPGQVVCLTSVELEHAELLGGTTEAIAYDKADLCRDGGVLVIGELDPELLLRLHGYCAIRRIEMVDASRESTISNLAYEGSRMQFDLSGGGIDFGTLTTPLLGDHQARNAAVAVTAIQRWLAINHRPAVNLREAVAGGLRSVDWPGRLQRISTDPEIVIDVGHTPQSLRMVAKAVKRMYGERPILLVTGVSGNKNIAGILSELTPIADEIVCTRAYHKGAPVATVAQFCSSKPCSTAATIEEAMGVARTRASATGMAVVVAGSLFLAIEALVYVRGQNPRDLRFF